MLAALAPGRCRPSPAEAYIGPGAGFALLSSFFVLFTTIVVAIASLLVWPFGALATGSRAARAARRHQAAHHRRPRRTGSAADRSVHGRGPAAELRGWRRRELPAAEDDVPLGVAGRVVVVQHRHEPGATQHLRFPRSRSAHLPADAVVDAHRQGRAVSVDSDATGFRSRRRELRLLRKSKPFWTILGEHRIWSTILRVPITFPPDRFYGAELSAMCVPDLLGTQGTFLLYTTRPAGGTLQGRRPADCRRRSTTTASRPTIRGPENTVPSTARRR